MDLRFERELTVDATADEIRSRLFQWASANDFICAGDLREQWSFMRGDHLEAIVSTDVRKVPTEAIVRFDPALKVVRAALIAKAPLSIATDLDAKRMEIDIEALVASIKGVPPAPRVIAARRRGGLFNAIRRGASGMKEGYAEAYADRVRAEQGKPRTGSKIGIGGVLIALVLCGGVFVGVVAFVAPQVFRVRGVQTPVNVTLREGFLTANVLRVQNLGQTYLPNVVVAAKRPSTGQQESRRIESIAPGQIFELGGLEWNWVVHDGDTVTVKADGFLPVVFTSDQMAWR